MAVCLAGDAGADDSEKVKEPKDYLREAVSCVITDEGFSVSSVHAVNARKCAEKFLEWISDVDNLHPTSTFATKLITDLKGCFHASKSIRVRRERLWEKYYKLRSSEDFTGMWEKFLTDSISTKSTPIFYQFVTDQIMEKLIKEHFSFQSATTTRENVMPLDMLDMNTIRYTAGYVVRSLTKKVEKSAHPLKRAVKLCLSDLEEEGGSININHESGEWTDLIDRGGLTHVSDTLFEFFCAMERELRCHLRGNGSEGMADEILKKIIEEEDVLYYWSFVATNWVKEEADVLLEMMARHWITIRGFSHASAFLEKYKQRNKKTVQKSKGLRKTLNTGDVSKAAPTDD